jgi:hypothetical protein
LNSFRGILLSIIHSPDRFQGALGRIKITIIMTIKKQPASELGNLSSKFFAYVQPKGKDIIRTGELAPVLSISAS